MEAAFDPRISIPDISAEKGGIQGKACRQELKRLCQDFEAVFINTLFREMHRAVPDDGYLEEGMGMDIFQEMMDMEISRQAARKGGFGLASLLYEHFLPE